MKWIDEVDWEWQDLRGVTWHSESEIQIRLGQEGYLFNDRNLRETLMHEILHVVWRFANLDQKWKGDQEESQIETMTPTLVMVMVQNPEVMAYVQAAK